MRLRLYRPMRVSMLAVVLASVGAVGVTAQDAPAPPASPSPPTAPEKPKAPEPRARAPKPGDIQRVFTIEHAHVEDLANVLAIFPVTIKTSERPRALGVSGPPAVVAAIEETIKRLDVAPPSSKDVELTLYVIKARKAGQPPDDVPEALSATVSQLRSVFGYGSFELVDTLVARGTQKSRIDSDAVAVDKPQKTGPMIYSLEGFPEVVSLGEGAPTIRIERLACSIKVPVPSTTFTNQGVGTTYNYQNVGIRASIEVRADQYVVVGKSGLGDDSGDALILVIKARLAE